MVDTATAHVPHLRNVESLLDLLAVCNLSILSNVLDFETYSYPNQGPDDDNEKTTTEQEVAANNAKGPKSDQIRQMELFDYNSKSPDDRAGCVYVRGLALDLLNWFAANYILLEPCGELVDTYGVLINNLCHQAYMIWVAKKKAVDQGVKGAPHCTLSLLERQLRGLFPQGSIAYSLLEKKLSAKSESETSMFMDFTNWKIEEQQKSRLPHKPAEIVELGMTPLDRKYAAGCLIDFDTTKVEDSEYGYLYHLQC